MNQGGIFSGPNALGIAESGSGVACNATNTALVREVQTYLRDHGAPKLKIDGVWAGCTASAFRKIFGRMYVTSDDIYKMTGKTCKSADTTFGGVLPFFTINSINVCNDGSDGVSAGGGGGGAAPTQECPAGSCWNEVLRTCVPDPFGLLCPGGQGQTTTPQQTQCPQGQVWNDMFKACVPDLFGGGSSQGSGPVVAPTDCPSGTFKNPLDGKCYGTTGVTNPTECPSGYTKIGGQCVAAPPGGGDLLAQLSAGLTNLLGGGGQPGQPGQPQPAVPSLTDLTSGIVGMFQNILGGGTGCPPGMVLNPTTGQCVGPGGTSVPPGWSAPYEKTEEGSVWGTLGYVIAGVLGIGAAATAGYLIFRKKAEFGMVEAGGDDSEEVVDFLLGLELAKQAGMESYGGDTNSFGGEGYSPFQPTFGYAPNRRRRGKRKSRKSRRGGRRGRRTRRSRR